MFNIIGGSTIDGLQHMRIGETGRIGLSYLKRQGMLQWPSGRCCMDQEWMANRDR